MKINLDFFNKSTGMVLVFTSLMISLIAFAGTLSINGDVNTSGYLKQGGNILIPSGAVMAFELSACPAGWTNYNVLPGYSLVQGLAGYNIGNTTDGAVKSHSHTLETSGRGAPGNFFGAYSPNPVDYMYTNKSTGLTGSDANYAAGKYVLFCKKN